MVLCSNRPDGQIGYFHTPAPRRVTVLSTCAIDVVLEPLGPILFLLFAALLAMQRMRQKPRFPDGAPMAYKPRHPRRALLALCTFLLVCLVGMYALELARLAVNGRGVGLLPLALLPPVLVGLSLFVRAAPWSAAHGVHAVPHAPAWRVGVVAWALWTALANGVKLASIGMARRALGAAPYDGAGSRYKSSDQIIDGATICGVYVVFVLVYPFLR